MRPVRLELHGFTAFRDEVVIDFEGADLFALAGPTGAGKSSIIDGMCFALYGSVPRLDRRTVAPVISTGKVEARIRLDFTIGERAYTAVRVVRRTGTGASTKEARLEHDGETLAGDADGMTAKVEQLLGLGFEQFTKSVVLPQGDFARFLHDKPSGRQELLVKLLELGVYERMRGEANTRRVAAESAVQVTQRQLEALADATPQAVHAAAARVDTLTALRAEIDEAQPQLDELLRRRDAQTAAAAQAIAAVEALEAVAVPDGVAALAQALADTEETLARASAAATETQAAVAQAESAREGLGDAAALQRWRSAHQRRATLVERIDKGRPAVAEAQAAVVAAQAEVTAAAEALTTAAADLERVKRDHAAHAVAATLVAGQPCPVCLGHVESVPSRTPPTALSDAEAAHAAALRAHTDAQARLQPLQANAVRYEQKLASLTEELAEVDAELHDAPPAVEVVRRVEAVTAADEVIAEARRRDGAARAALAAATKAVEAARARHTGAWAAFDRARDAVAAVGAPPVERTDLAEAWQGLASWAAAEAQRRRSAADEAKQAAAGAAGDLDALQAKLTARCEECAVVVRQGARSRDAVGDAVSAAEAEHRRLQGALEQAQRARLEIEQHQQTADVAKELGKHLSSRGFEQWLLDEALTRLAEGATDVLLELSAGQYSLALDAQRNFVVIDHRSADEQRPARTLSGGETFLASLSLALTLAEHLTQLAVGSEPKLESIFLDEGFGTLDAETLDVVAAAIEELGARGRTVGIITHVRDLAERMPVRFDVRKGPGGSTVERVER